jgi:hypothetical protein
MGGQLLHERVDRIQPSPLMAYLHALEASGVSISLILGLAEQEGMSNQELIRWTDGYLNRNLYLDHPEEAVVLVFGCVRRWKDLLPSILSLGTPLIEGLLMERAGQLESLSSLATHHFPPRFRERILRRMGYPACLSRSPRVTVAAQKHLQQVMSWLGTGRTVVAYELELRGFQASSPHWGIISSPKVVLTNGVSPACIQWRSDQADPINWHLPSSLRVSQVQGFRHLGGFFHGQVFLADCPDLETVDGECSVLEARNCPNLTNVVVGARTTRVVLGECPGLAIIKPEKEDCEVGSYLRDDWSKGLDEVTILDCPNLRTLPPRLKVRGRLHLHGVGPVVTWPWDIQVGEMFLISDCPNLEALPALDIQGSLVVTGHSGLRRLSPGTIIGKHLDLRACSQLEGIPRGVKVGGTMFLPEHLNHRSKAYAGLQADGPVLVEAPDPDLYEEVRAMLLAMRFSSLLKSQERPEARERAEEILLNLKARLIVDPKLESLLLWTASEAWRDLAEEDWGAQNPLASDWNETDEDLPMAWLLGLLRE